MDREDGPSRGSSLLAPVSSGGLYNKPSSRVASVAHGLGWRWCGGGGRRVVTGGCRSCSSLHVAQIGAVEEQRGSTTRVSFRDKTNPSQPGFPRALSWVPRPALGRYVPISPICRGRDPKILAKKSQAEPLLSLFQHRPRPSRRHHCGAGGCSTSRVASNST